MSNNMKKVLKSVAGISILSLFIFSFVLKDGNDNDKNKILEQSIMATLEQGHFSPLELNDDFSKKVFKNYLKTADNMKLFFTKEEIESFKKYENEIDDEVKTGELKLQKELSKIYDLRIKEIQVWYNDFLKQPIDLESNETIETDEKKVDYAKDINELKNRWHKYLQLQILMRIEDTKHTQDKLLAKKDTVINEKSITQIEEEARKKVLENQNKWFERLLKLKEKDKIEMYINAITMAFDPHTNYFAPEDKTTFDISMSGQLEGIGARLQEKDGYVTIMEIIIGGPAYKNGELKDKDQILKVAQENGDWVDIVNWEVDEAVKLIRGKKGTKVRLTVKHLDGTTKEISLIRDIVQLEETYAKSLILQLKNDETKIGYIRLPKFYADFNKINGRNCANDIKIELEKLIADNVNGAIIDLRDNSGGSLTDAVNIGGHFIDKGPMVQVKSTGNDIEQLPDKRAGIIFDKPLIILTNINSASASEILAAALQDYGRAIIVGSESTYGKGTVQRFIDLDQTLPPNMSNYKPLGSLKVTIQKFYRINGGATQLKGVRPDIILPDVYSKIDKGEKENDNSMPWDEIKSANYNTYSDLSDYIRLLKKNSQKRIKNNQALMAIETRSNQLAKYKEQTAYNLNFNKYNKDEIVKDEEAETFKKLIEEKYDVNIYNPKSDEKEVNENDDVKKRNNKWIENTKKDPILYETTLIINDFIDLINMKLEKN